MRRQFDRGYWRQWHSSDVTSVVIKTEERAPEAVRARDEAKDDHTGGLRSVDAESENTYRCRSLTSSIYWSIREVFLNQKIWQLPLHCHLRPPIPPVVRPICFKGPIVQQHNRAIREWVIDDSITFPGPFSGTLQWAIVSQRWVDRTVSSTIRLLMTRRPTRTVYPVT